MDTLKSRQPPHTCRVTDAFGSALIFGRYSSSSAWQALSEAESPGPPEAPAVYLQRHSRATFSKETPVSPMSAIRTARVRRAVEGTSRDGEEEKRASMSVWTSERASVEARRREIEEGEGSAADANQKELHIETKKQESHLMNARPVHTLEARNLLLTLTLTRTSCVCMNDLLLLMDSVRVLLEGPCAPSSRGRQRASGPRYGGGSYEGAAVLRRPGGS